MVRYTAYSCSEGPKRIHVCPAGTGIVQASQTFLTGAESATGFLHGHAAKVKAEQLERVKDVLLCTMGLYMIESILLPTTSCCILA